MLNFSHTEEQQLIANSLDRLLQDNYPFTEHLRQIKSAHGFAEDLWRSICELGITAVLVPEEFDGLGGTAEDVMVIMEQVGRHRLVSPLLSSAVIGTCAISCAAGGDQKKQWLPLLAAGEQRTALAITEPTDYGLPDQFRTVANGNRIAGHKSMVHFGQCADYLIVAAQCDNEKALYRVDIHADGVKCREYRTHDGGCAADFIFEDVVAERLGESGDATDSVSYLWDLGAAAVCAEALGCMDTVYVQTRDYLKVREQFGFTLASFQSLQHRLVDMHMACELSRAITCEAVWAVDNATSEERCKSVDSAKVLVGQNADLVGKEGIQLHGGIGMTWELPIGHYFKRLTAIDQQFGDKNQRLDTFQRKVVNL